MITAKVKSIKYLGKQDVYNMEVKKYHNFSVNDGLIVHNSMDELRYYLMSKPEPFKPPKRKLTGYYLEDELKDMGLNSWEIKQYKKMRIRSF